MSIVICWSGGEKWHGVFSLWTGGRKGKVIRGDAACTCAVVEVESGTINYVLRGKAGCWTPFTPTFNQQGFFPLWKYLGSQNVENITLMEQKWCQKSTHFFVTERKRGLLLGGGSKWRAKRERCVWREREKVESRHRVHFANSFKHRVLRHNNNKSRNIWTLTFDLCSSFCLILSKRRKEEGH